MLDTCQNTYTLAQRSSNRIEHSLRSINKLASDMSKTSLTPSLYGYVHSSFIYYIELLEAHVREYEDARNG